MSAERRRAAFLDRDGTINREVSFIKDPDRFSLLPGAAEAIRLLNEHNILVVVVTNQSGIARGYLTEEDLRRVHERMFRLLAEQGAAVDAVYFCPHHPTEGDGKYTVDCECRKPKPGMLSAAAKDHAIDLSQSWMVSDKLSDLQLDAEIRCRTMLVRTGFGEESLKGLATCRRKPDGVYDDLFAVVRAIVDRKA